MATVFTNQATLNYNGSTVQSNITTGSIEGVLSMTKAAVEASYSAGSTVTYIVSIVNNGSAAVSNITLTDNLGAYTFNQTSVVPLSYVDGTIRYYINGEMQSAPAVTSTDGLVVLGLSIPANGNIILVYSAQVNEFAPLNTDGEIINTVSLSSARAENTSATETITADGSAILSILKAVTPATIVENGEISYTFQLQNAGNTAVTEADNATVTDTFTPTLSNISVMFNGESLTQGTGYTYDEATGVFSTADGVISIPAATFTQDPTTGAWTVTPGSSTLVITGTINPIS